MKIDTLVTAYERSVKALNEEAELLRSKIKTVEGRAPDSELEGRIAARLSFLQHQLDTLHRKHRAASCWVTTIAEPILSVIGKQLGSDFKGALVRETDNLVRLRFTHVNQGSVRSMTLRLELDEQHLSRGNIDGILKVVRTVEHPERGLTTQNVPLNVPVKQVASLLVA